MDILNVEIKAYCSSPDTIRSILEKHGADFQGTDQQTDTYFEVAEGRLKLREGSIENNLIYYQRPDDSEPKASDINLVPINQPSEMKALLTAALDIMVIVEKEREIYFIDNVKFHIDEVDGLGNFVEIEAIDRDQSLSEEELRKQCQYYLNLFDIPEEDLISVSYSDMLLAQK